MIVSQFSRLCLVLQWFTHAAPPCTRSRRQAQTSCLPKGWTRRSSSRLWVRISLCLTATTSLICYAERLGLDAVIELDAKAGGSAFEVV